MQKKEQRCAFFSRSVLLKTILLMKLTAILTVLFCIQVSAKVHSQTVVSLTVKKDGILSPFVLRPRHLEKPKLPVMDVMFCRGAEDLHRCAPALARHFLPKGSLGFLIDGDMEAMLSHYVEGREPRYFKGPYRPVLGDLAYTEKAIFG